MGVLGDDGVAVMPRRRAIAEIATFFIAAYLLTWGIVGAYILFPEEAANVAGPMRLGSPAFFLAVYVPTLTAFGLSLIQHGRSGAYELMAAAFKFNARWYWIVIAVLAYPAFWLLVAVIRSIGGEGSGGFNVQPWLVALPAVILSAQILRDPGALGEEFGWRGYALPRLLSVMSARAASVVLGLVWAIWHLPAFYVSTLSQSKIFFPDFVAGVVGISILMTLIFVNTRGSLLWGGIIPHFIVNAAGKAGIGGPGWIMGLAGLVILLVSGRDLRRSRGKKEKPAK